MHVNFAQYLLHTMPLFLHAIQNLNLVQNENISQCLLIFVSNCMRLNIDINDIISVA